MKRVRRSGTDADIEVTLRGGPIVYPPSITAMPHEYLLKREPTNKLSPITVVKTVRTVSNALSGTNNRNLPEESDLRCKISRSFTSCWSPIAFGRLKLPNLKNTVQSTSNKEELVHALSALCDALHDPETTTEALRIHVLNALSRRVLHPSWIVRYKATLAVKIIAGQHLAKIPIVKHPTLLGRTIANVDDDDFRVRKVAAEAIHELSVNSWVTDHLVKKGCVILMMSMIRSQLGEAEEAESGRSIETLELHLNILEKLMDSIEGVNEALEHDVFSLMSLMKSPYKKIYKLAERIFAKIIKTEKGQKKVTEIDLMPLIDKLESDFVPVSILTSLNFCTLPSEYRRTLMQDYNLIENIMKYYFKGELDILRRISIIQLLIVISETPMGREKMKTYLPELIAMNQYQNEILKLRLKELVDTVLWTP